MVNKYVMGALTITFILEIMTAIKENAYKYDLIVILIVANILNLIIIYFNNIFINS